MLNDSNNRAYNEAYNCSHLKKLRLAVRIYTARIPTKRVTAARQSDLANHAFYF